VEAIRTLLRFFSYAYHGVLALFLLLVAALALASSSAWLQIGILPWSGLTLAWILLGAALAALAALLLAAIGGRGLLFMLWNLLVAAMLIRGYVFSSYRFAPGTGVKTAIFLMLGSWLALAGAWFAWRNVKRRPTR